MQPTMSSMENTLAVTFKDRLDRQWVLHASTGESIATFLSRHHIPIDAVIVKRNGSIIDDGQQRFESQSQYTVEMVRSYHLPDFLSLMRLWPPLIERKEINPNSFYTKRLVWYNDATGDFDLREISFDRDEFVAYLDNTFVEGVRGQDLIKDDDRFVLALSGGRDSLALAYFLNRNREQLPNFSVISATVEPLAAPKDQLFAREIADIAGFEHHTVSNDDLVSLFGLRRPVKEVLNYIRDHYNQSYSIHASHATMRAGVELLARKVGVDKIAWGLQSEDLFGALLKAKFIGTPMEGPWHRRYGVYEVVYPIWSVTKKELTLYLEVISPSHNTQGPSLRVDRGAFSRDIYFYLADLLETHFPGSALQLMAANQRETHNHLRPMVYRECDNCKIQYNVSYHVDSDSPTCEFCRLLDGLNLLA